MAKKVAKHVSQMAQRPSTTAKIAKQLTKNSQTVDKKELNIIQNIRNQPREMMWVVAFKGSNPEQPRFLFPLGHKVDVKSSQSETKAVHRHLMDYQE